MAKNDIERIDWNGDFERRLEGLAKYPTTEKKLQDFYGGISDGEQICEIYSFYEENFALGRSYNIEDKYFLIDHINLLGKKEGLILIRNKDIDYFCFETQYIKTFPTLEADVEIKTLVEFLEYLKQNQIPIEITTEKKTYNNVLLTEYNDKFLFVFSKKRRIKIRIEKIKEIDSTIMN
ncbi:MAG: hypothetical protein K2O23_04130 [Anaeroplasmataceae bacterium]|nr:hypothetical protein [Anaeroplasmataceae bacterium]